MDLIKRDIKRLIQLELNLYEVRTWDRPYQQNAVANTDLMKRIIDE